MTIVDYINTEYGMEDNLFKLASQYNLLKIKFKFIKV